MKSHEDSRRLRKFHPTAEQVYRDLLSRYNAGERRVRLHDVVAARKWMKSAE